MECQDTDMAPSLQLNVCWCKRHPALVARFGRYPGFSALLPPEAEMWTDQELDAESLSNAELHKGFLACRMFAPRCTSAAMVTSGPLRSARESKSRNLD